MSKETQAMSKDIGHLAQDAGELMAAAVDSAGEKVGAARKSFFAAMESGKEIAGRVRDRAVEGARAAAEVVRQHPYQDIGIALGIGVIVGLLLARRRSRNGE